MRCEAILSDLVSRFNVAEHARPRWNEADVKFKLVVPVLCAAGVDVFDPTRATWERTLPTKGRVDGAFEGALIIETKAYQRLEDPRCQIGIQVNGAGDLCQIAAYCRDWPALGAFFDLPPLAVTTSGCVWYVLDAKKLAELAVDATARRGEQDRWISVDCSSAQVHPSPFFVVNETGEVDPGVLGALIGSLMKLRR